MTKHNCQKISNLKGIRKK